MCIPRVNSSQLSSICWLRFAHVVLDAGLWHHILVTVFREARATGEADLYCTDGWPDSSYYHEQWLSRRMKSLPKSVWNPCSKDSGPLNQDCNTRNNVDEANRTVEAIHGSRPFSLPGRSCLGAPLD